MHWYVVVVVVVSGRPCLNNMYFLLIIIFVVWWVVIGVRSRTNSVCLALQVLHCCVVSIELRMNVDESNSDEAELRPGCEVFDNYGEDDEVEDDDNDFLSGFHFVKDPNEKNIENAPYLPTQEFG